jgi:FkbM family methyltransferase
VVYEVGGFVGYYTLHASVLVGSQGKVFAFEPSPRNLPWLKEHVRINHLTNVTVIEVAVGELSGTAAFRLEGDPCLSHPAGEGDVRVQMIALDDFIRQEGVPKPDFMKIDVVGSEMGVLNGAKDLLARYHPTLFMHVHTFDLNPPWVGWLEDRGYHLEPIGHKGYGTPGGVLARWPSDPEVPHK